jgi:hypothetical protein
MIPPHLGLLLFHLMPVAGVLLFGWNATALLLLYWGENVILGLVTLAKVALSWLAKGPWYLLPAAFYCGFFVVHYGIFCAVHGVMIFVVTDPAGEPRLEHLLGVVLDRMNGQTWLLWNMILIGAFHGFQFYAHWMFPRAWRHADPQVEMFQPYGRIVVIHVALLGGGFAAQALGQPVVVVAALALLKALFELGSHLADDEVTSGGNHAAKPPA